MEVYLDNSSTTFPKPKQVINAMCDYMLNVGGNAGRGNYSNSLQSNRYLYDARELICNFLVMIPLVMLFLQTTLLHL